MVKTGARAAELRRLMTQAGMGPAAGPIAAPRLHDFTGSMRAELKDLYRQFGGVLSEPVFKPGGWDLTVEGDLVVELDEEFHFTRYRRLTLDASFERDLPWSVDYRRFTENQEARAIAPGGRWANPSTDRMFGGSDEVGQFTKLGSSRWKQRALYDAMKDAAAATGHVRLSRVSIYDSVAGEPLDRVLHRRAEVDPAAIAELVQSRTSRSRP